MSKEKTVTKNKSGLFEIMTGTKKFETTNGKVKGYGGSEKSSQKSFSDKLKKNKKLLFSRQ